MKKEPFLVKNSKKNKRIIMIIFSIILILAVVFFIVYKNNIFKNLILVDRQKGINNGSYEGFFLADSNVVMKDTFSIEVPSVFIDKSLIFNYEYYYDNNAEEKLNRCSFSLVSPYNYTNSQELIEEIHKYHRNNNPSKIEKKDLNNLTWSWFKVEDIMGINYYYGTSLNDKVYLFNYLIEEKALDDCQIHIDEILNSLVSK